MNKQEINIQKIIKRITRLKIALFILSFITIAGMIYMYSSESGQPFMGKPKELNQALLLQEVENANLLFKMDSIVKVNKTLTIESEADSGILFEVQVSSSENFHSNIQNENLQSLNFATIAGVNYITLGKFRDVDDAKLFIEDIKKIGINNATIISKLDGKRVQMKE